MKRIALLAAVCAAACGEPGRTGLCRAADGPPGPSSQDKPLKVSELTYQQQFIRSQFERLTRQMVEVARMLEEGEPESARAIYRAVAEAKAADIDGDLAKVVEHLQAGLTVAAGGSQRDAVGGLNRVLELLLKEPPPLDANLLKRFRDEARNLLKAHRGEVPPSKDRNGPPDPEHADPSAPKGRNDPEARENAEPGTSKAEGGPKDGVRAPTDLHATADKTENLAGQMRSASTPDRAIPGAKEVAGAGEAMRRELAELKRRQGDKARASGDEAESLLQRAIDLLDRAIEDNVGLVQAQVLLDLAEALQKALDDQQRISRQTRQTYARRRDGSYDRAADLALAGLADGEADLRRRIEQVRRSVVSEGTTKVFPVVLGEVGTDLDSARRLLADRQAGPVTQSVQKDIEENLASMVAALRAEQKRRNRQPTKQPPTDPEPRVQPVNPPPLVPPVAELKMLRTLQGQINTRTVALDAERKSGDVVAEELKLRHEILSHRQQQTEEMTRQLGEATR